MPINRGMDKEDADIYNGILLRHKKNNIVPFTAKWMDLEIAIMSEVSQIERDKYCKTLLISGIFQSGTNEHIYKTEIEL